jgi:L-fuconolactonase
VIDAHHHFWGLPNPVDYPWLTDELAAIRRPFGPEDLRPLLEAGGGAGTVLVQTRSSLAESREFLAIAERCGFVAGVVAWVDLTAPDVARQIDELRAGPGGGRLVGIRHQVHDEPDPRWLLRDTVLAGLEAVADAGLVYDLLVREPQLPAALECARRLPDLAFVIDHLAKPRIARGPADPGWEQAMAPFADLGNVACKISGMVTEADWTSWRPADLAPYIDRVVGWFGDERLLFGSDWPVCLLAADYGTVVATAQELLADRPPAALGAIFGGNASRIYRLGGGECRPTG